MYTLNENRKPKVVSLGVQGFHEEETFHNLAYRLHQEEIESLIFFYEAYQHDAIQSHQIAAFACIPDLLMKVTTRSQTGTYTLPTFRSDEYEITPEQLIILLDNQQIREHVWQRITQLIVDSNRLNSKTIFTVSEARMYLCTQEGRDVVGYMVNNLVQEIQITCCPGIKSMECPWTTFTKRDDSKVVGGQVLVENKKTIKKTCFSYK